jgi:1-acyl-sn-glycerol-3-phosphate acyltransferase
MAPAVPIAIRGSRRVLPPKTRLIRGGEVEVSIGAPILPEGLAPAELAEKVRTEIVARFEREGAA